MHSAISLFEHKSLCVCLHICALFVYLYISRGDKAVDLLHPLLIYLIICGYLHNVTRSVTFRPSALLCDPQRLAFDLYYKQFVENAAKTSLRQNNKCAFAPQSPSVQQVPCSSLHWHSASVIDCSIHCHQTDG